MKHIFVILFLCLIAVLSAQQQKTASAPDSLFTGFALRQTMEKPVFLDIQAGDRSGDITTLLKSAMLAKGYMITEDAKSDANTLQVKLDQSDEIMEVKKFWGYKRFQISKANYTLQLLDPEKKIISFTHFEQYGQPYLLSEGYTGKMKWYDPIMLFAIIGSLVYIIWTTN
ncbi:MAG TPA: hypothetical protein PLE74_07270 [Candidatus Cloacimonadota bacterium]|nr:hypothetical protein [Candidatus Cloacimonadota bacterium]HPT72066.1 hypothetical protein [Candidatus Cloacimonadota bacterium]